MADEWQHHTFGALMDVPTRNGIHKGTAYQGHGVPVVKMGEVYHADVIQDQPRDLLDLTSEELERLEVLPGDLLFCRTSLVAEGVGHCAMVGNLSQRSTFASNLIRVRLNPKKADSRYWFYYFRSPYGKEQLLSLARGTSVTTITGPDIAALNVLVPNTSEQCAITHILGTLDDKIELNRRMNETLEAMARALFKSWFVDFDPVRAKAERRDPGLSKPLADLFPNSFEDSELGEIPKGWKVVPIPEVIEVNPARSLRKREAAPYLDMANMPMRGHTPDDVVARPFGSGMRFINGDTLVARITPCLENGKTAFVDFLKAGQVGWGSTEYIVLCPKSPLPEEFAYCLARSSEFREFAIQSMTGSSGRQRVPSESLSHYLLAIPPEKLARQFGSIVKPLFARASAAACESRTLTAYRDTLLPRLISGEIRTQGGT